jgi:DNA-binding NarL/FixJ family response regulator
MISILLVDDHPMMRAALRSILSLESDFEIAGEATDGLEAIQVSRQAHPDVILMDVYMPRMDGIESTRCIRGFLPNVCVIGMSSASTASLEKQFLSAGARAFLHKEVAVDSLVDMIRRECAL